MMNHVETNSTDILLMLEKFPTEFSTEMVINTLVPLSTKRAILSPSAFFKNIDTTLSTEKTKNRNIEICFTEYCYYMVQ